MIQGAGGACFQGEAAFRIIGSRPLGFRAWWLLPMQSSSRDADAYAGTRPIR
jgi:hypothetical protein